MKSLLLYNIIIGEFRQNVRNLPIAHAHFHPHNLVAQVHHLLNLTARNAFVEQGRITGVEQEGRDGVAGNGEVEVQHLLVERHLQHVFLLGTHGRTEVFGLTALEFHNATVVCRHHIQAPPQTERGTDKGGFEQHLIKRYAHLGRSVCLLHNLANVVEVLTCLFEITDIDFLGGVMASVIQKRLAEVRLHAFRKIDCGRVRAVVHKLVGGITEENGARSLTRLKLRQKVIQWRRAVRFYACRERANVNEIIGFEYDEFASVHHIHPHPFLKEFQGCGICRYECLARIVLKQECETVFANFFDQSACHAQLFYGR